MKYDFNTVVDRSAVGSFKWDLMKQWNPAVEKGIIPLSVADMELKNPPEIIQGLKDYLDSMVLGYTGPTPAYFEAVRGFMARRHGWQIEDEWLVQTNGVVPAFFNAIRVFSQPGDSVLCFTPAYYPFYRAVESQGRQLCRIPLVQNGLRYEIDFDLFEEKASLQESKILLFCSPHNPVGRVWTRDELMRVVDICLRHDVLLVSDEIHFDLVMPGHRHIVISTLSEAAAQNSLVLTAPSKTFNLAGAQCSNAVIQNPVLRQRFKDGLAQIGQGSLNILAYKACEIAYSQCEAWLDQLLDLIHHNYLLLKNYFEEHLQSLPVFPLEGTYLAWMDFRALGLGEKELEQLMYRDAQAFMDEGYFFGPEGSGFERINLAAPSQHIMAACQRIHQAVLPHLK